MFPQGMTGVPGFSGSDGIPVRPSTSTDRCSPRPLLFTRLIFVSFRWFYRATQDKVGPGEGQEPMAAMERKENQG